MSSVNNTSRLMIKVIQPQYCIVLYRIILCNFPYSCPLYPIHCIQLFSVVSHDYLIDVRCAICFLMNSMLPDYSPILSYPIVFPYPLYGILLYPTSRMTISCRSFAPCHSSPCPFQSRSGQLGKSVKSLEVGVKSQLERVPFGKLT